MRDFGRVIGQAVVTLGNPKLGGEDTFGPNSFPVIAFIAREVFETSTSG